MTNFGLQEYADLFDASGTVHVAKIDELLCPGASEPAHTAILLPAHLDQVRIAGCCNHHIRESPTAQPCCLDADAQWSCALQDALAAKAVKELTAERVPDSPLHAQMPQQSAPEAPAGPAPLRAVNMPAMCQLPLPDAATLNGLEVRTATCLLLTARHKQPRVQLLFCSGDCRSAGTQCRRDSVNRRVQKY